MECPVCGYNMDPFLTRCPHCARMKNNASYEPPLPYHLPATSGRIDTGSTHEVEHLGLLINEEPLHQQLPQSPLDATAGLVAKIYFAIPVLALLGTCMGFLGCLLIGFSDNPNPPPHLDQIGKIICFVGSALFPGGPLFISGAILYLKQCKIGFSLIISGDLLLALISGALQIMVLTLIVAVFSLITLPILYKGMRGWRH